MKILLITIRAEKPGGLDSISKETVKALREVDIESVVYRVSAERSFFGFVRDAFRIRKLAREFDIVHALDGWPLGVYAWLAVLGTTKKLFIDGIGTYTIAPLYQKLKKPLLRWSYERAQKIFCMSRYTEVRLLERLPYLENTLTLHMGTNPLPEASAADIARVRSTYNLQNVTRAMITVGDIKYRKGQLNALKAMHLLTHKYPSLHYLIVGDDRDTKNEYVEDIKQFAQSNDLSDRVHILPSVSSRTDLSALYSLSDLYIMISNNYGTFGEYFEGFGLVFLEAASLGLPVIGSSGCGIEDAVQVGYNGYLAKQGDTVDIASKIEKIYQGDRQTLSEHSKKFAQGFSWYRMAVELKKYYIT